MHQTQLSEALNMTITGQRQWITSLITLSQNSDPVLIQTARVKPSALDFRVGQEIMRKLRIVSVSSEYGTSKGTRAFVPQSSDSIARHDVLQSFSVWLAAAFLTLARLPFQCPFYKQCENYFDSNSLTLIDAYRRPAVTVKCNLENPFSPQMTSMSTKILTVGLEAMM